MAKKSEINKKGRLAKSTLSVVLAASMVLTSSSFVWAAPVEDIAIVEEGDAAVEAVAAPVEETVETGVEENVRAIANVTVSVAEATYTGGVVHPAVTVVDSTYGTLIEGRDYNLEYDDTTCKDAGVNTAKVTIDFIGDYDATKDKVQYFTIKPFVVNSSNVSVTYPDQGFIYDGKVKQPTFTIAKFGSVPTDLTADLFETVAYDASYNLSDVGNQRVKLACKSTTKNYVIDGILGDFTYNIDKVDFTAANVNVVSNDVFYTGSPVAANVSVNVEGTNPAVVLDPSEYTIKYFDKDGKAASGPQTNVGTYKIQIVSNGTGNFKAGTVDSTYRIRTSNFDDAVKEMTVAGTTKDQKVEKKYAFTYNGAEQAILAADITIPGLTQGVDYTVDLTKTTELKDVNSAPNTPAITTFEVTGINKFDGSNATITLAVLPKLLSTTGYTISAQCSKDSTDPFVVIKDGDKELVVDTDFTVSKVAGKNAVKIEGIGNYTTEVDATHTSFEVPYTVADKILMNDTAVTATLKTTKYDWTGKQITPVLKNNLTVSYSGKDLVLDTDYTVSYGTNVDSGDDAGSIIITGKGDYSGTRELKFDIVGVNSISKTYKIKVNADTFMEPVSVTAAKAGNGKQNPVIVFQSPDGASAPSSLTYKVNYLKGAKDITDNAEAFKALKVGDEVKVVVTGTGKYSGTIDAKYKIVSAKVLSEIAKVDAIADQPYTGKAIEPTVVVKEGAAVLTFGKDYTVSYTNNTDAGTAFVTITGMGNYTGTLAASFKIVGQMDQEIVVLPAQEKDLGNGSRTLKSKATKVKYSVAPKTEETYASSNTDVVEVDAKTGDIKYTGVGTAVITITAPESDVYKAATKELTVKVVPITPSNVKVTSTSKKKITVKADEVKEATKYQIRIQKDGHSSVYVNVDNKGDLSKVYTTKSSGKFNVWVRAYKTVGGVHHFSAWSAKKAVTIK